MGRVIVVGAGISGLACARELTDAGHRVSLRERSATVGGRMASPRFSGRLVDSGASYFTASESAFVELVDDWCARGLARRWTNSFPVLTAEGLSPPNAGPWRYATPGGLRSLVADLADGAPTIDIVLNSPVSVVEPGPTVDGTRADAVVLAMPDPQARRLLDDRLTDALAEVSTRRWEPVLALLAQYRERSWPEFEGAFINGDPTLSWVADDGRRRGDGAPVLVAHSTPAFAAGHLDEPDEAAPEMIGTLDRLLGCGNPSVSRVHRWMFARPSASRETAYYFGAERIGLAGDAWGSPRVETAWLSGRALGRRIAQELAG
jgi:renalase